MIKAVRGRARVVDRVSAVRRAAGVTVLLDAHDPSGAAAPAGRSTGQRRGCGARLRPVILSGGLTPTTSREAVDARAAVRGRRVVGVESGPGVKDAGKLRAFFAALGMTGA